MKKNMGVIKVNLEIFEFFGTQTIEGSRTFNPVHCLGFLMGCRLISAVVGI
jgi:hypothetical protein